MQPCDLRDSHPVIRAEAWILVSLFAVALRVAPGRVMRRMFASGADGAERIDLAAHVAAAVEHAGTRLPKRVATCLPRACAAHVMLARRGATSSVRIGVLKTTAGAITAHAWVESGGLEIGLAADPDLVTLRAR
jgi:hypothetical protein